MKYVYVVSILFLIFSCNNSKIMKYDYISEKSRTNKISHYSVVAEIGQDVVFRYYYYRLKPDYNIKGRQYEYLTRDDFDSEKILLKGLIELRYNVEKGAVWKSIYHPNYIDSLSVEVVDILKDTVFNGFRVRKCYVYELKHNPLTAGEDYQDYRIFFDPYRKVVLKKEYYINNKYQGQENIVNESIFTH